MNKTLKTFAMAMVLTGATVTATRAQTVTPPYAVETLSVQLTATYSFQDPATTNDRTGTITDKVGKVTIATPKFIELLATNLGITNLSHHATLIKVTQLAEGVNYTNVITNLTTLVSNATFLVTNIDPTNFVFANNTNGALFVTNPSPSIPTGYHAYSASGAVTNLVQAMGDAVIVGTNVQFFINNGPGLDTNNFLPVSHTNDNAAANIIIADNAPSFLNTTTPIDDQSNLFEEHIYPYDDEFPTNISPLTNFFMAQRVTNGNVFAGTIKTDFEITGTIYGDALSLSVGPPAEPIGTPAPPQLSFAGRANSTSTTATVGSGKSALPFTSWNGTYTVTGGGTVGGVVTNALNIEKSYFAYYSNATPYPFNGFDTSIDVLTTNPPATIGNYTNVATNYYTNYSVINPTNSVFTLTGTVQQTFMKIVQ